MKDLRSRAATSGWICVRERLTRITTGGDYLPEVDGIRFLAITCVLLQHMYERVSRRAQAVYPEALDPSPGWLFQQGDFGVQLFFALSGFILFRGLVRTAERGLVVRRDYGRYLLRRLTRLEPPYLLVITGIFLFLSLTGYQSGYSRSAQAGEQTLAQSYFASVGYAHTWIYGAFPKLNPPTWSLETEFQFYLLAPLIVWPLRRCLGNPLARLGVLSVLIVVAGTWLLPFAWEVSRLRHGLAVYLPLFLVGFAAGEIQEWLGRSRSLQPGLGRLLDVAGFAALYCLLRTGYSGGAVVYCGLILALILGCTGGTWLKPAMSWGFVPVLGGMCYSIYLVHLPFLEMAAGLTRKLGLGLPYGAYVALQGGLLLGATFGVATFFYLLVERPCMDRLWPQRLGSWARTKWAGGAERR